MKQPFGYTVMVDAFQCIPGSCDDLELHYRFLERLVDQLGMTKMTNPFVVHAPQTNGVELFPDKAGCSGWIGLIESGIQIHSIEPTHFMTLDVYSCKGFSPETVSAMVQTFFDPVSMAVQGPIARGVQPRGGIGNAVPVRV